MQRFIPIVTVLLAACGGEATQSNATPAPAGNAAPSTPDSQELPFKKGVMNKKVELGKMLFFDPRLSGSGKMSCATCHPPEKGWADGKPTSPKDDGSPNKRNTPTMINVGYLDLFYWDGRAPNLAKNIHAAWTGQTKGDPATVAERLMAVADYEERFQELYGAAANAENIVESLSMFIRMLKGEGAAFDRWRAGDQDAVSAAAKAGYGLFMGKGGCAVCHQEPLFTDKKFHNAGVGMDAENPDLGRGPIVDDPRLNGWFKTPTLREVARTAPYFHDGSVATLEEAVRFMASGGRDNPTKSPEMLDRKLSDEEISQLVEFLKTLSSDAPFERPTLPE